ncbi:hypothetical protein WA026_002591 [Henosepilachna vigintioctopunctata]|uniref:Uncharacterized protein n=1 Tax=Henosepilachna vigintioctopunctata TaxID=420089 RepID=A0AAW1U0T1_9CUCU
MSSIKRFNGIFMRNQYLAEGMSSKVTLNSEIRILIRERTAFLNEGKPPKKFVKAARKKRVQDLAVRSIGHVILANRGCVERSAGSRGGEADICFADRRAVSAFLHALNEPTMGILMLPADKRMLTNIRAGLWF